ncbi:MAG TPA: dienelactone hydrolase family protein [Acidimicrobiales bacterium]|nr:dienelactone hydrolase family protein [Acidimicrobiales bacterium]
MSRHQPVSQARTFSADPRRSSATGPGGRAHRLAWAATAALVLLSAGCSSSSSTSSSLSNSPTVGVVHGDTVPVVTDLGPNSFTGPGPFSAGVTTLTLPSDGALVEVWYPAPRSAETGTPASYNVTSWLPPSLQSLFPPNFNTATYVTGAFRDAPVEAGRFPLVVFTHGYSGFRDQSTFLTTRLASWGFVVAAPDLQDNDLTAVLSGKQSSGDAADLAEIQGTINLMSTENDQSASPLDSHLDLTRIAAVGHSLGGAASEAVAAADPRVTTFIGMAGATVGAFGQATSGPASEVPQKPGMLMVGTADHVVNPTGITRAFHAMATPKRLVTFQGFGHLLFSDICEIAPGKGGLLALADQVHLPVSGSLRTLATDGCFHPDSPVTKGWPAVRQTVIAQLRHVFDFDSSLAGLTGLTAAFPGVVATNVAVGAGK